jgi:hypothetical protein
VAEVSRAGALGAGGRQIARQQAPKLPALFVERNFGATPPTIALDKLTELTRRIFYILTPAQKIQAIHLRHPDIGKNQIEGLRLKPGKRFFPVGSAGHFVALLFQEDFQELPHAQFVIRH